MTTFHKAPAHVLLAVAVLTSALIASSAAFAAGEPQSEVAQPPSQQPNVVMIISDDQGWTDYGFMGHPHIQTPHLDRLAAQSLTFRRGYVPTSLCRPSLSTMATGLYPHQHGITGNDPAGRRPADRRRLIERAESLDTLPDILGRRGYLSMQSGKWWEGHYKQGGFTHGMTQGYGNVPDGRHGDRGLTIGRKGLKPVFDFMDHARAEERPFLLWYAPFMPHTPHTPPERLLEKYREKAPSVAVARYWAMCEWFDETCGDLLAYLDEHNLTENTLVVYVCDNGWIQHPDRPNRYAPRSKRSPYEMGVRTPIMVRWPGRVAPRDDSSRLASSIDLAPTILSACGVKPTDEMPGIDLTDDAAVSRRQEIFGETFAHDIADVEHPTRSLQYRWMIQGNWKLLVPDPRNVPNKPVELFNLAEDPHEKQNLAEDHAELVDQLRDRLNRWWRPGAE